jgi:hypothetical protein
MFLCLNHRPETKPLWNDSALASPLFIRVTQTESVAKSCCHHVPFSTPGRDSRTLTVSPAENEETAFMLVSLWPPGHC